MDYVRMKLELEEAKLILRAMRRARTQAEEARARSWADSFLALDGAEKASK